MISPFLCYASAFSVSLLVYMFGWSDLYGDLNFFLIVFLVITIAVTFWFHVKKPTITFKILADEKLPAVATTIFIFVLWTVEFIYEGGIPLVKILFHLPYNYRNFGVPSLHVFVVTFSSFFTIYLFHLYRSNRSRLLLFLYLINLFAAVLIYSRAMLFFNITGSLFVYLLSLKTVPYPRLIIIVLCAIPIFYIFGVLGSLRVSREAREPYNNENFMDTGKASESFRKSVIPKEYFWTYIYISSPLANLQLNIDKHPGAHISVESIFWTGIYELLPDFITKRIHTLRDTKPPKEFRINYSFNVSTVYSRAFSYSGWAGMTLMALFIISFPRVYQKLIGADSDFLITGWAILCTMYFFLSYDNTFRFTGLSLQLAYPVLFFLLFEKFQLLKKYSIRKNNTSR